jgi:hypothetical protein
LKWLKIYEYPVRIASFGLSFVSVVSRIRRRRAALSTATLDKTVLAISSEYISRH